MNRRWIVLAVAVVMLIAASPLYASGSPDGSDNQNQLSGPTVGTTAFKVFSTGGDGGTTYRISPDGNVFSAESPSGFEHIEVGRFLEGYVLCYTPSGGSQVQAFDDDESTTGFGTSTATLGPPVVVTRTTSDGKLRLKQVFAFASASKALKVTMTVTNLTGSTVGSIVLRRVADFDVDSLFGNDFARTLDSAFGWNDATGHGMILRHLAGASHSTKVVFDPTSCSPTSDATPALGADEAVSIDYALGNIAAGASKTVTVQYERI